MRWNRLLEKIGKDPFRLFFPLGWALGLLGVALWVPFAWREDWDYPGGFHVVLMSRGFLSSFILGFLMTAIPRFTETQVARSWEVGLGLMSVLAAVSAAPSGKTPATHLIALAQIAVLILFIGRRFRKRRNNPPSAFLFVGVGLLLGALGTAVEFVAATELWPVSAEWALFGRLLSFYAMVLALVLGVGARLFPGILGWAEIVQGQRKQYEGLIPFSSVVRPVLLAAVAIFCVSFVVESFFSEIAGRLIRATTVSYVAIVYWRLHRRPPNVNWMKRALLVAAWGIVLGEWLAAAFPGWGIDGKHLVYVSGFSCLALLIGSRVTLAHGAGLFLESRALLYAPFVSLIVLGSLARTSAHWASGAYFPRLAYAAFVWLLGAILWGVCFLPRIFSGLSERAQIDSSKR
jgi:uncharacterized protein involved in response to NO